MTSRAPLRLTRGGRSAPRGSLLWTTGQALKDRGGSRFNRRIRKELGALVNSDVFIIKSIDLLVKRGYDIVVATNPIFPLEAVKERIHWAGLDVGAFKYITSYEEMHFCKPNVEYYNEVLNIIAKEPYECIMVGNDVEEDMIASKLGIKTFLVEDCIINREGSFPEPDYRGAYADLYRFIYDKFPVINLSN